MFISFRNTSFFIYFIGGLFNEGKGTKNTVVTVKLWNTVVNVKLWNRLTTADLSYDLNSPVNIHHSNCFQKHHIHTNVVFFRILSVILWEKKERDCLPIFKYIHIIFYFCIQQQRLQEKR